MSLQRPTLGQTSKALQSNAFPHAYLRIDGTGVNTPLSQGGGTVNCQSGVADFERFEVRLQPNGTVALASVAFPNVYLRMDGRGIRSASDSGAGTVNCQFGVGPWEKFHQHLQLDGTVTFESTAFPGVYLRVDARDIGEFGWAAGTGTVNCQFGVGPWEKFILLDPPFSSIKWQSDGTETSTAPESIMPSANHPQDVTLGSRTFRASDYESDYPDLTDGSYLYQADWSSHDIGTNTYDYVAPSSAGASASLGVNQPQETVEVSSQTLGVASSVTPLPESEVENQDAEIAAQDPDVK
jgi:hypothetical protein